MKELGGGGLGRGGSVCAHFGVCVCVCVAWLAPSAPPTPRPLGLCSFSTSAASSFHFPRLSLSQVSRLNAANTPVEAWKRACSRLRAGKGKIV